MSSITVPDIGDFKNVPVIEILVEVGQSIADNQPVVVVESDKATIEIPSSMRGVVQSIAIKIGDKVSQGDVLLTLEAATGPVAPDMTASTVASPTEVIPVEAETSPVESSAPTNAAPADHSATAIPTPCVDAADDTLAYAGPAVRKLARQLGVDLKRVNGSGLRGRILVEDVHAAVKAIMTSGTSQRSSSSPGPNQGLPFALPAWPQTDFAQFGPIETQPLSRIRKISGPNLHRNWVSIPHVTNHDDADITELERFRQQLNQAAGTEGVRISPLAFILKACVAALKKHPAFNASLDGENIVLKRYWHIGFAADTPQGLVVPVIRDADQKGIVQIAQEMKTLSEKARAGRLSAADMQGGTFSVSSLGGIGGSYFTPIINAPEVAILGVGKTQRRVILDNGTLAERLLLPLSLSWDHRVVDGAAAGRFNADLAAILGDVRRLLL